MRILLIEDDRKLAELLRRGLRAEQFDVEIVLDGEEGFRRAISGTYDVIILDRDLPRRDGMSVCRALRGQGNDTPILMLTIFGAVADRIAGLSGGADDYLPKPFDMGELVARLRALVRRRARPPQPEEQYSVADLEVHVPRMQVTRAGQPIQLSRTEFALLVCLLRHAGQVCTRALILDRVWGSSGAISPNQVDVYIHHLRQKVDHGYSQPLIRTVHGVGYFLDNRTPAERRHLPALFPLARAAGDERP